MSTHTVVDIHNKSWEKGEQQRLVTTLTLQRKRARIADKKKKIAKAKSEAAEYQKEHLVSDAFFI